MRQHDRGWGGCPSNGVECILNLRIKFFHHTFSLSHTHTRAVYCKCKYHILVAPCSPSHLRNVPRQHSVAGVRHLAPEGRCRHHHTTFRLKYSCWVIGMYRMVTYLPLPGGFSWIISTQDNYLSCFRYGWQSGEEEGGV